jgi:predicted nucleotide-binding protein (sugar kinase/HSP70/actin superfamily)
MGVRIGIPQSLLFYHYYPLWRTFFRGLGAEVVLSPPTNRAILKRGMRLGAGDLCLPMKVHLGHVESLRGKADFLFQPRLVSFSPDTYLCPKFLGLPDVVRAGVENLPPLLTPCINAKLPRKGIPEGLREVGSSLDADRKDVEAALTEALEVQGRFERLLEEGWLPLPAMELLEMGRGKSTSGVPHPDLPLLAVVGHPYNLYDTFLNFDLLDQVRGWGFALRTPEMVSPEEAEEENTVLRKKVYWSLTRRIVGSALRFLRSREVEGMILISSFGCGPDSFSKELIDRRVKASYPLPYLSLIFDEHTSQTGVQTRLDAFLDMVKTSRKRVLAPDR